MEITIELPISDIRGIIGEYYTFHMNGKTYLRKRPKRPYPPSQKQLEHRQEFIAKYGQKGKKGAKRNFT